MFSLGVIGSTGSIGTQTLDLVRKNPTTFRVLTLSAKNNWKLLLEQVEEFQPEAVALSDAKAAEELKKYLPANVHLYSGKESLMKVSAYQGLDAIVAAVVGFAGLEAVLAALEAKVAVAFANKETLVAAGELIMAEVERAQVMFVPIDSEHNSLRQCLDAVERKTDVKRFTLTASGGPFFKRKHLEEITPEEALKHPNWDMGAKISIDSATLMNKGLELIEARWLFDVDEASLGVVVHPQSIVHGLLELADGSSLAALAPADMRVPIAYALDVLLHGRYPAPRDCRTGVPNVDLISVSPLEFFALDNERFPAVELCLEALRMGGCHAAALNAANEVAVERFLQGGIPFTMITEIVRQVMKRSEFSRKLSFNAVIESDSRARLLASKVSAN